jgi:Holliday junction DNA helicase RuvA
LYHSLKGIYTGLYTTHNAIQALIDVGGVEWQLDISRHSIGLLPRPGEIIKLFTYLHHAEDQHYICGFVDREERQVFLQLLKVQGIGPKAALKILSGTTPARLITMLEAGDIAGLEQIPGLGKKTSQKVLLTLQGKLVLNQTTIEIPSNEPDQDIIQALIDMGFDRKAATAAVTRLSIELTNLHGATREQELLRRSIIELT